MLALNRIRRFLVLLAGLCFSVGAQAQDLGVALSPILTIDSDRAYSSSAAGRQLIEEMERRLEALVAENRTIEAELEAEEKDLTERRPGLPPSEFRVLADAFDAKVQRIRSEQDTKQRDIQQLRENGRKNFVKTITPILSVIGNERGALVILERRDVLLSADAIDITDLAIARINASLSNQQTPDAETPATVGSE